MHKPFTVSDVVRFFANHCLDAAISKELPVRLGGICLVGHRPDRLCPGGGHYLGAAPSRSSSLRGTRASRRPDRCQQERPVAAFSRPTVRRSSSGSGCAGAENKGCEGMPQFVGLQVAHPGGPRYGFQGVPVETLRIESALVIQNGCALLAKRRPVRAVAVVLPRRNIAS